MADADQRVGPYVKYVGAQSTPMVPATEKFCWKCGSSDIDKQSELLPEGGRPASDSGGGVAGSPNSNGVSFDRREIAAKNIVSVTFGDLSLLNILNFSSGRLAGDPFKVGRPLDSSWARLLILWGRTLL